MMVLVGDARRCWKGRAGTSRASCRAGCGAARSNRATKANKKRVTLRGDRGHVFQRTCSV